MSKSIDEKKNEFFLSYARYKLDPTATTIPIFKKVDELISPIAEQFANDGDTIAQPIKNNYHNRYAPRIKLHRREANKN